ncbi:DUF192 domain-containing protein [Algibacter amylolyticus]|uniref:DUF192 domain-containing protein n=1 Tax=Algibacter amylolyticus TaxID=1608400 RepID=A0A5M7BDL8_9FLAO|nr:DUF192 domain-containing protein [Algibacter amylolyticus]KAA5825225.1 DUF192 domain-containing protein [Algibacter amylolyticus]TSJ77719.1 DUF192 domain-containing protein [Algibacter amylolyticus]
MTLKPNIIALLLFLGVSLLSCKEDKKVIKQTEISFTKEGELSIIKASDATAIKLDIEIADTDFDIQTGLMYRNSMANNQGMLFVFDDEKERFFYMKNTKIPLDLIYINANKIIVSFQKNAKPFDESSLPSNTPAKYVLEVNAGLVDVWGIAVGDQIIYETK